MRRMFRASVLAVVTAGLMLPVASAADPAPAPAKAQAQAAAPSPTARRSTTTRRYRSYSYSPGYAGSSNYRSRSGRYAFGLRDAGSKSRGDYSPYHGGNYVP